ncbi:alpha-D-ribose 1-methylphosphonate 5-triphosphate diphosphatase [Arthrobacter sp. MYb23]|uniref:alpha-D-ribose 1-methylphosphonate 5-triphosphate diphosphatase n=1 Tax=unclassified Arthrobacter TaxID=235627 RepID=UPI000CFAD5E2|nr:MULTISPECIES: alpha-D-ribose 1-methylphosphonate 5-triphosphate diphosphatase [unclassified Arthrobacter]PRB43417.1 alpha-D-ribose 1-methylphosphonate 5-triphosphate diphosphatase [Arthrobacter sp. MYb51]PRB96925.1 alpha-D-ribose 1-methylphosphonate 5-triphosphate diphosphatase [Arthrobacter sp. MYb23]
MLNSYTLGHVRAVTPEGILEDQLIRVSGGVIEDIGPHRNGTRADVDGRGLLCLPGLVDVHSDALAREYRPRPGAVVPVPLALHAAESNLLAAGVTTAFHAMSFQLKSAVGIPIKSPQAPEIQHALQTYPEPRMDHRVLHRLDVRCPGGIDLFREQLAGQPGTPLVSYEDHTPGQGQYKDRSVMERWLQDAQQMTPASAKYHVDLLVAERDEQIPLREQTLGWLSSLAADGSIKLMGHDPTSPDEIDDLIARHATIAEFPTTVLAARHAAARGVANVAGAPNILLGGSHSGNVSAAELAQHGVLHILASDYLPSSLLPAAFELARLGHATLSAAIGMITAAPAAATGLHDRGQLVPGLRADLLLCSDSSEYPRVTRTFTAT